MGAATCYCTAMDSAVQDLINRADSPPATGSYASSSAFRAAFPDSQVQISGGATSLRIDWHDTPIGPMLCVADEAHLYMLEFTSRKAMARGFDILRKKERRAITPGRTTITQQIKAELTAYFKGELKTFKTPLAPTGTAFQKQVWAALQEIPYGQSYAYSGLAAQIGNEKAVRAVASANARNLLALIIPCHRIIAKDGGLGGYAGGLDKKSWLLTHESAHK